VKRIVSGVLLLLLLMAISSLSFNIKPVKSNPRTITVPDDCPTIQDAVRVANSGDTVYVRSGVYFENVVVDKSISLIGEK
jgi:nitrous oxidase accessory protein NosD